MIASNDRKTFSRFSGDHRSRDVNSAPGGGIASGRRTGTAGLLGHALDRPALMNRAGTITSTLTDHRRFQGLE
jgi:hypothetical protein